MADKWREIWSKKTIKNNFNISLEQLILADGFDTGVGSYNQLQWKEEMIDLVKPKWYDNKYLWFFGGMIITSGSIYLAGQIK